MSRHKTAYEVTRIEDPLTNRPASRSIITRKTTAVFDALYNAGHSGITTKDMPGWDVRHYLRNMRKVGIVIEREMVRDGQGGKYGRWRLARGYRFRKIPLPRK